MERRRRNKLATLIASRTLASKVLTSNQEVYRSGEGEGQGQQAADHHGEQRHGTADVYVGHDTSQVTLPAGREDDSRRGENLDARRPDHGHWR
ncbi:hypothetical protein MTO96_048880 [Rhipicephalus appendiculatus]